MDVPAGQEIDLVAVLIGVLGGLAIFLFGMDQMTEALKIVAGNSMRNVLRRLTTNRFAAAFTGAFVTGIIQSSSVTTVLVVGFISAGLMTLQQSIGVIMGANIGSTVTGQLIAFKVTETALPLITLGFAMLFLAKRTIPRQVGTMIMGLGMIFFGMAIMGEATYPLRGYEPFVDALRTMNEPVLAILVSAAFTAIVQSSAATTGLVIMLASQGFITLETGIALALGANIGTCATALLAAVGKPRSALQAAVAHVSFNIAGVILWFPLIGVLAEIVRVISPSAPNLDAAAQMAAETPRQIANAHTLFNVANTLLFIWLTGPLARLIAWILPEKPPVVPVVAQPRFLEEIYLDTPALAIERLRLEIGHLGELVLATLDSVQREDEHGPLDSTRVGANIADVNAIDAAILDYTRLLLQRNISPAEARRAEHLLAATGHLQSIADTISVNFGELAREWGERQLEASDETRSMFRVLSELVRRSVVLAIESVREVDPEAAAAVVGMKPKIAEQADALSRRLSARLATDAPNRIELFRLESEIIEIWKRLYYFAKRVAKTMSNGLDDDETPRPPAAGVVHDEETP